MKYIEELQIGDTFTFNNELFILTADFKANGDKNCISLNTGCSRWLSSQDITEVCPIYTLDKDNTIIPVKQTKKDATF